MQRRTLSILLAVLAIIVGGGIIAALAYNAGVAAAGTSTAGAPAYAYWGHYGWGWGFGFLGFLFPLFFFILVFLVIRAIVWGGRGPGWGGRWDRDYPRDPRTWQSPRDAAFEEWHRRAHEAGDRPTGNAGPPQS